MADPSDQRRNLETVLLSVVEGSETAEQREWLNDYLRASEEARVSASRFLCDESLIADQFRETNQAKRILLSIEQEGAAGSRSPARREEPPARQPWRLAFRAYHAVNRNGVAIALGSAAAILALVIANVVATRELTRLQTASLPGIDERVAQADATPTKDDVPEPPVAIEAGRIIALNDVAWRPGEPELTFGDPVMPGQTLQLESGVVELLMATGAKVTVEGPSSFRVGSANESTLSTGKLAAAVPRTARGYTVLTPTSELVDIGTQFGVSVDDAGATELHVFDGDVVARALSGDPGSNAYVHATESQVMRFDDSGFESSPAAESAVTFIRRTGPVIPADQLPSLPITEDLFIWYAPESVTEGEAGTPVPIWRDLLIGENDFANDAWQFEEPRRPRVVYDEAGRKALRFDGWSTGLKTAPFDLSKSSTVFVACAPGPISFSSDYHGGILVKLGNSPSLELTLLPDNSPRAWVWPGMVGTKSDANVGVVSSSAVPAEQIAVVAYRFDPKRSQSSMWVNASLAAESDAPIGLGDCARICVGSHADDNYNAKFLGLIYEVLVYDSALEEESVEMVSSYLAERYPSPR